MPSTSKYRRVNESLAHRWAFVCASALLVVTVGCGNSADREGTDSSQEPRLVTDSLLRRGPDELRLIRLADERGTVHEGWLRRVPAVDTTVASARLSVLLLGGIGTHKRAVEIVPCPPGATVLALDYPYRGNRKPTHWNLLVSLPAIRAASTATPRGLRAAIRYLASRPDADPRGGLVIGASFGGTYVLKAMEELPRAHDAEGHDLGPDGVRAVAVLYWGANLPQMARYRMRERPAWEGTLAAAALQWFFADLEPSETVRAVSPRPLLLVNGERDEWVSHAAAESLFRAASQPVQQVWLPTEHMQPSAEDLLRRLVGITLEWLDSLDAAGAGAPPPGSSGGEADRG